MSEFISLSEALEGWFDKPFDQLPTDLRARVGEDLWVVSWDSLSAEQRRAAAEQWDYQHDPATEAERTRGFNLLAEESEIEHQLREVELLAARTPSERESKVRQLEQLRGRLEKVRARRKQPRSAAKRKASAAISDSNKHADERYHEAPGTYVHFLKARDFLKEKWGATAEEIGIWVWMGRKAGGLNGYRDALQYDSPPQFFFSPYDGSYDYVSELMHCFFEMGDLEGFVPSDRYLARRQGLRSRELPSFTRACRQTVVLASRPRRGMVGRQEAQGSQRGGRNPPQAFPRLR